MLQSRDGKTLGNLMKSSSGKCSETSLQFLSNEAATFQNFSRLMSVSDALSTHCHVALLSKILGCIISNFADSRIST